MIMHCKKGIRWIALTALILALLAGTAPQIVKADTLCVKPAGAGGCETTIQAAIDLAETGDTINIYPGDYNETAEDRTIYGTTALYTFGLYINTDNLTLQGVNADGTPISDANQVAARIKTNATNSFGSSGIWVESNDVTISGVELQENIPGDNKTIEVIGDNFTLQHSNINVPGGGSVYLNDWRYDDVDNVSYLKAYHILNNKFSQGASLDISSGAGYSGDQANRVIRGNQFLTDAGQNWPQISFNGTVPSIGWFVYPVGGAIIEANSFEGTDQYIRYRGPLDDENRNEFDFAAYFANNSFPFAAMATQPDGQVRSYSYTSGSYLIPEARRISGLLSEEIDHAQDGDTVNLRGNFTLPATTINVTKDITITGLPGTILEASGAGYRFQITGAGATLQNLEILKTDKTGGQDLILINANDVTIQNNLIHGQWVQGDAENPRAMAVAGGKTGILIQNNTIFGLRQPAYMNNSTLTVKDNTVYGTRGWVVDGALATFTGNSWGDGTNPNAVDIALLNGPDATYRAFYDLPSVSSDNNNAVIETQMVNPYLLSDVLVDASAPDGGDGTVLTPYNSIAPALARVVTGGTINIKNGAYSLAMPFNINKAVSIIGESQAGVVISPTGTVNSIFMQVTAQNVSLKNLTLDGNIPQTSAWPPPMPFYGLNISKLAGVDNLVTIENVTAREFGKSGFNFNNAKGLTLTNVTAADNGGAGIFLTNAHRITLDGLTTSNNQWGGVAINIIDSNNPTPLYGTSGIVFSGALSFNETNRSQGGVYLEEEYYASTDPGVISYSLDGSPAMVQFPAGLFQYALSGQEEDYPTRRVRFYTTLEWATSAAESPFDATGLTGPGHLLGSVRQLTNLVTGEVRLFVALNTDSDDDNEILATYISQSGVTPTINLSLLPGNPAGDLPAFATPDAFYDIQVLNNTDPEAVMTVVMEATNGKVLRFWDGSHWVVVRNNDGTIAKAADGHLTLVFGPGSTPKLSDLTGTPVVASALEAVEIQITPTDVQQNRSFTAQVVGKSTSLYGVQVFLTFDATRLSVTSVDLGEGLQAETVGTNSVNQTAGTIQFGYSQMNPSLPVSGDEIVLATITFQAKDTAPLGEASVGFDDSKQTIFADLNGFALGVYPGTLDIDGDSIIVTSQTIVSGQVTRQGRTNFAGTSVDLNGTIINPDAVLTGPAGTFSFNRLVTGAYDLIASYNGYLTAQLLGKNLGPRPYTVPAVMLLGGDATHDGEISDNDLSVIGLLFMADDLVGQETWADINEDGVVNILDLVMAGSNHLKTATPWTWTPTP